MGDLALEPGVASEFVRYLNAQLKETRDKLQRSTEDNATLREELEALRTNAGLTSQGSAERSEIERMQGEVNRLRKELDDARNSARGHQAEATMWRTRYEQLKPQLTDAAAQTGKIIEKMRQELAAAAPHKSSTGQTLVQFRALLRSLPSIAASSSPSSSRVVFRGSNFLAAVESTIGGFCFFGCLLEWSAPPSQHAYAIFPEYRYNPKPADDESTWTAATDCTSLAGEQRELFYVEGEDICYAGTFLCHAGPRSLKVADLAVDSQSLAQAVARKTFHVNIKSTQSRQAKAKTYVPLLADLYTEGVATVRILGLQRVGFNKKLFEILRKAHGQRERKASESSSTNTMSSMHAEPAATPAPASRSAGKKRDWFDEIWDGGETEGSGPGPSKVPRLVEAGEMDELMTVWRA
ncbi:hypothetical protein C8T65DRAFT_648570 [Cerioporus squamosus]|nr:hypothetical protein C8T65DRAFT_648570 [Cerioporus squamosus]